MSDQVTIVDIKMPFMSMVIFMVKAAIAAIPAMIILSVIGSVVLAVMGALTGTVQGGFFTHQQF